MMICDVVLITPTYARNLLTKNHVARKLRKQTVNAYALDMKNGKWCVNNNAIVISEKNKLLDGQHRLHACVESGVSFESVVLSGCPEEEDGVIIQETMDRGIKR